MELEPAVDKTIKDMPEDFELKEFLKEHQSEVKSMFITEHKKGGFGMKLSYDEGKKFYDLWLPLLDYVNEKRGVNSKLRDIGLADYLDPNEVKEVSDVLWEDVGLIDEYLKNVEDITDDDRELIMSWKHCVIGRFILERILKKGAILISIEDEEVYQVSGIVSTWDEMFGYVRLPLMIHATLIPFKDVIISDGLIQTYNVIIGGNMARSFKDTYMAAKKDGMIHKRL